MEVRTTPLQMQIEPKGRNIGRTLLGVGIVWLMLGMVIMPAGVSFNPGKPYQASLALLLYLPAIGLSFTQRARAWRELWPLPAFRVFLALLAWSALSIAWGHPPHPGDTVARALSVLAFVLGWHLFAADVPERIRGLLFAAGVGIAGCALYYCVAFAVEPETDGRIIGQGVIATANYAAALMGVVALWLSQLDLSDRRWSVLRYVAIAALLVFVGLTQTRSVWLALAVTSILMPLWQPRRRYRWIAVLIALAAIAVSLWPSSMISERGTSLRPELFMQSLHLIAQHPLLGLGQGVAFNLIVNGAAYTHTHNLLTQVTVELGLPGLLLTVAMWLLVGWQGWRHRASMQGRLVLAIWVYASIVLQFDMPQMLGSARPTWLLVWMPLALTLGMASRDRESRATYIQ